MTQFTLRSLASVVGVPVTILLGACAGLVHEEVGSTHVGVLSVTRFDDYKAELQPVFSLKPDEALARAIPDTLQFEQAFLDSFRAKVGLKLAPSDVLPAGYGEGQAGADVPGGSLGDAPGASSKPAGVLDPKGIATDPHLSYLAATALFQEVQLLNRYVTDAAIRGRYKAYIVRLQVTNMPRKHRLPYDAYVDMAFFMEGVDIPGRLARHERLTRSLLQWQEEHESSNFSDKALRISKDVGEAFEDPAEERKEVVSEAIDEYEALLSEIDGAELSDDTRKALRTAMDPFYLDLLRVRSEEELIGHPPIIVPLLVTDQVEAALASRRAEYLQQLTLSLSAAYAGIGGTIDADSLQSAMRSSVAREFNSLFTVGRLSDNTLRVRIGARQSGRFADLSNAHAAATAETQYEMVPQTHNVSLLVLVRSDFVEQSGREVYVGTQTRFVNAATGKDVPYRSSERGRASLALAARSEWGWTRDGSVEATTENIEKWATLVQNGDRAGFVAEIAPQELEPGLINQIWLDLTTAKVGGEHDSTQFTAPQYPTPVPSIRPRRQTVTMADDGKRVTATIVGTTHVDTAHVSGEWHFDVGTDDYRFAATDAKLAHGGRHLVLTFPSAAALKLKPTRSSPIHRLTIATPMVSHPLPIPQWLVDLDWKYNLAPVGKVPIKAIVEPRAVHATKLSTDTHVVLIRVTTPTSGQLLLGVRGARATSLTHGTTPVPAEANNLMVYKIDASKNYTLELAELVAGTPVRLVFKDPSGVAGDVTIEIKVAALPK